MNRASDKAEKTPDRRLAKTRKALKTALIRLMSEKELSKISITELTDVADISRKTFYLHYASVEDVLDEIENEVVDGLREILHEYDLWECRLNPYIVLQTINGIIGDDPDFYRSFVAAGAHKFLMQKIKSVFKEAVVASVKERSDISEEVFSFAAEYAVSGVIALYIEWFESGSHMPLAELADLAGRLAADGMLSMFGKPVS